MKTWCVTFLALLLLTTGCKEKSVFHPLPLVYEFLFLIALDAGDPHFNEVVSLSAAEIQNAISEQLTDDIELSDLRGSSVESLAYRLLDTDQLHGILDASIFLEYEEGGEDQLTVLENEILGNHLNIPDEIPLTPENVETLETAMNDIVSGNLGGDLSIRIEGDVIPNVTFMVLQVELTISHIVEQSVEIFDPL